MKQYYLVMALGAISMLSSCSSDDLTSVPQGKEITFTATAGKQARSAQLYCNNNKPQDFNVWAVWVDGTTVKNYFSGDKFVNDNGVYVNDGAARYWPEKNDLSFLAIKNHDNKLVGLGVNGDNGSFRLQDYMVNQTVAQQEDLIYAIEDYNHATAKPSQPLNLNFRHALSQIVFRAKNLNPNLYIEITGVSVCKVKGKGTYTFSTSSNTTTNINDHTGKGNYETDGRGTWDFGTNPTLYNYNVTLPSAVAVPYSQSASVNLTDPAGDTQIDPASYNSSNMAMLLMPQTTTAWDTTKDPLASGSGKNQYDGGSYIKLNLKIWNVADGTSYNAATDMLIYDGTTGYHGAYLPLAFNWLEGKKYIYTIVFENGNGGIDPDDPDNPKPVLSQMKFSINVDDFVLDGNTDVPANASNSGTYQVIPFLVDPSWDNVHGMDID